jgi:hypothetical protein
MLRRRIHSFVLALALSAAGTTTVAIAPRAGASSSTTATTKAKVGAAGIALAYPKGWTVVPASASALRSMVDALGKKNPKAAAALENATKSGLSKQVKLYAIDLTEGTGQNVNVLALGAGAMPSNVSEFETAVASQYRALDATLEDTSTVTIRRHHAYRADVTYPLRRGDGTTATLRLGQLLVDTPRGSHS